VGPLWKEREKKQPTFGQFDAKFRRPTVSSKKVMEHDQHRMRGRGKGEGSRAVLVHFLVFE
jgi:hypothetical protein